jgi:hypothetical protein
MQGAIPQPWSNLVWAAATLGCNTTPGSPGDVSPLVRAAVAAVESGVMRSAKPQEWANLVWAASKLECNTTPGTLNVSSVLLPALKKGSRAHGSAQWLWDQAQANVDAKAGHSAVQ